MIQKAKDAQVIGIIFGTLSVNKTSEVIDLLETVIKNASKKSYLYLIGKLNEAKL